MSNLDSPAAPIRLALAITELEVGGAERCLVNVAIGLDRRRFLPEVYSLAPHPAEGRDLLVRVLEQAGIPVHFLNLKRSRHFLTAMRRLRRMLVEQRPDVLQTFLFHANLVGAIAGRWAKVPAIATGVRVAEPNRFRQWLERFATRRADRIVCVSDSVAQFARAQMRLPTGRICVIPNGINVSRFPATPPVALSRLGVANGKRAIVYVGRLADQKRVDWLLRTAPQILTTLKDHCLIIVGDGPRRADYERLAESLSVARDIYFTGWRADVPNILAACDLLVLPSRFEGMPNVLLEAMATALPVVATRVEGVEQVLGPWVDYQAADVDDANGFARRVIELMQDPARAADLGRQNRQRVVEFFSLAAMVRQYEHMYADLYGQARRRR